MNNKKGFTLAEVMITLATLGVIAAILVPAVMSLVPDNSKVMFRKAHYALEQAVSQLSNDEAHYPSGSSWSGGSCAISGFPVDCVFHNTNTTLTADIPAGVDKFCYLLADSLNIMGTPNCAMANLANDRNTWSFQTTDGIKWRINYGFSSDPFPMSIYAYSWIIFDVNGDQKPNCLDVSTTGFISAFGTGCSGGDVKRADIHGVMIRYDGKISLDSADTFEQSALSNPLKTTK